jgi:hypothetical protein
VLLVDRWISVADSSLDKDPQGFTQDELSIMCELIDGHLVELATAEQATVEDMSIRSMRAMLEATADYQDQRVILERLRKKLVT